MFNQIQVLGNLTKDIELSYTQSGNAFAKGSVASNRKYKTKNGEERQETTFLNFIASGKIAEICNQYLKKGSKVFMTGRLSQNNYTDKNGNSQTSYQIVVEKIQFLDVKPQSNSNASNQAIQPNANHQGVKQAPAPAASNTEVSNTDSDDEVGEELPF
ncbi:single-stranded DNA-binding protein [Campylobacter sp. MIT 97-5078]|uniref:single-stranded DNA-binding protein n=1 Tax=Campylobacter sp. MIT 97-5078 TaxID=1548153 RepID=UPI000512EFD6|nr:single-stranded DNA-binding protein [Campylobacter sp. MIT 97-5078]KGI55212.1 hypothetical protein LR59_12960 [Campylobacter sp. MIT 97-5078]TQR27429.1 single-stranded DNA-binding protein [Campylobacter sp. MIT 97-5078]